jgi:multiple sugar transport system substrate-binding protein
MKPRLTFGAAITAAALLALAACGSGSGSSPGSGGSTKLVFFGADYGTGPANSTTKYWDAIATAFHKANPGITVSVQTVDWTDFPDKVQTLVQNKQSPDILEGDAAPQFAQSHLLTPTARSCRPACAAT